MQGWGLTEGDGNICPAAFELCPLTIHSLEMQLLSPPNIILLQYWVIRLALSTTHTQTGLGGVSPSQSPALSPPLPSYCSHITL